MSQVMLLGVTNFDMVARVEKPAHPHQRAVRWVSRSGSHDHVRSFLLFARGASSCSDAIHSWLHFFRWCPRLPSRRGRCGIGVRLGCRWRTIGPARLRSIDSRRRTARGIGCVGQILRRHLCRCAARAREEHTGKKEAMFHRRIRELSRGGERPPLPSSSFGMMRPE
jgi:hypothetical protein